MEVQNYLQKQVMFLKRRFLVVQQFGNYANY